MEEGNSWKEPVSFSQGQKDQGKDESQAKEGELFQPAWQAPGWKLEWLKKKVTGCSDWPVNAEAGSITTNEKSRSAVSASFLGATQIPRMYLQAHSLCLNPPWGSWPGSMRWYLERSNLWKAVGWFSIWPEEGISRSAVTVSENLMLCMAWGLRAIYQKPRTTVPGEPSGALSCLWTSRRSRKVDQVWANRYYLFPLRKGFLYLVAVVDCSPGNFSQAGNFPTALTWNSAWSLGNLPYVGRKATDFFHSDQGWSVHLRWDFVARLQGQMEIISSMRSGRGRCFDTSWWRGTMEGQSNMRRCTCALQRWLGKLKFRPFFGGSPDSYWRYCHCKDPIAHWGGKTSQ